MCLLGLAERSPGKKCDIVLLAVIGDEIRFPVSEAISVLHGDDRDNLACSLNMLARHIGERNMPNLALLAQFRQCFYRCLERHSVVGSVKLIDVDTVEAQTLQTSLEGLGG